MDKNILKLLENIRHNLTTEHGLYVTDVKSEAIKIDNDKYWQLNNEKTIKEIDKILKK